MNQSLHLTPLVDWHVAQGARMVDFAGWSMPLYYKSITDEHIATRQKATLFDVSHMGRFVLTGTDAGSFLQRLLTRRVDDMGEGRIRYSLVTNEEAGILDDVLVYRIGAASLPGPRDRWPEEQHFRLVVNASNRQKIWDWLERHARENEDIRLSDVTEQTAMIALQGPQAVSLAKQVFASQSAAHAETAVDVSSLRYYRSTQSMFGQSQMLVSRTGYTGEDGLELVLDAEAANALTESIFEVGKDVVSPAGLGARDTLRLEAAMPLYGHELDETINPLQAGLGFAVDLDEREFPGANLLRALGTPDQARVGLVLDGKRVPREGYSLYDQEERLIGHVTSGTFSPTLLRPIAMAYVQRAFAEEGTRLVCDLRGRGVPVQVVSLPFYRRKS